MDDDGGLGIRNWGYYDPHPPIKGNLGLQLMSASTERDTKPLLSTNSPSFFLHRVHEPAHTPIPSHQIPMDFARAGMWAHRQNSSNNKLLHVNSIPTHHTHHQTNFSLITENTLHALPQQSTPFLPQPEPIKNDQITPTVPDANILNPSNLPPIKKRAQAHEPKTPKPKKPKKVVEPTNGTTPRGAKQGTRKDTGVVINGIDLDLSRIPTPICSCTGIHQQCYRWGIGGWQSACCTTSISIYPLPMSEKRRGARIAGRKMSQGAFKKVLEKLAGEGYNLSNPIDLRGFWAKHGTNKFVTIK